MDKIRVLNCNRCLHEWATRREQDPKVCPKCHNPYWDKERVRPIRKQEVDVNA